MDFISKYNNYLFEDEGPVCSKDFKTFARAFKTYLTKNNIEVCKHSCNHYDFSGFAKKDDTYVYYSWSWNRFSPVDVDCVNYMGGLLVRHVESLNDYQGMRNHFCSLRHAPSVIKAMLEKRA